MIKTRQDKTTLFYQGSPVSCKAGILRGTDQLTSNSPHLCEFFFLLVLNTSPFNSFAESRLID